MIHRRGRPPRLARWLSDFIVRSEEKRTIPGDIEEFFYEMVLDAGEWRARVWFWMQVIRFIPAFIKGSIYWSIMMFQNYLKIAFRNLVKHKGYSLINIAGLAIGMACCMLILMFVQDELSYDRFHENADHIYRVTRLWYNQDGAVSLHLGHVAPPIAPLLDNDFSEIIHAVRMIDVERPLLSYGNRYFEESRFFFAEEDIFKVFSFEMVKGDPSTALVDPFTVVITEEMADKYFGSEDPLGKTLTLNVFGRGGDLKVTGVIKSIPHNSHFHVDFMGSFKTFELVVGDEELQNWGSNNYATYLLMPQDYDINRLRDQLTPFIDRHYGEGMSERTQLRIQRLTDIHLHSHLDSEIEPNSDIAYVYIFSVVAIFILLIACINFMNLATARSAGRAREVGLRKVVGARRSQVIRQFLNESILMAFIALGMAILMVLLVLPQFSQFLQRDLSFHIFSNTWMFAGFISIVFIVGIVSGSYPAFYLSAFRPVRVLRGLQKKEGRGFSFRALLVVTQFAISIILIVCVGIVSRQLHFMRQQRLGFDKENVVVLPSSPYAVDHLESVKQQLLRHENIVSVSAAKRVPSGRLLDSAGARVISGEKEDPVDFQIAFLRVDHDYVPTFGMELAAGRNFSRRMSTDSTQAFILNETAVKQIGWESPEEAIGQGFGYGLRSGQIIGVVKDFHFESMHQPISPIVMLISSHDLNQISIRIRPYDIPGTLEFLKEKWQEYRSNYPFQYYFIDENFDSQYQAEEKLYRIVSYFAFIAILIACLGLFGLASYTAEQRTKEIGIRKVLGASVSGIALLLSKEFTKWVVVANIVAWPIAYFLMNRWLQNFAYRIDLSIWIFIFSGMIAILIAIITVSSQSMKAATSNPVDSLRYE